MGLFWRGENVWNNLALNKNFVNYEQVNKLD